MRITFSTKQLFDAEQVSSMCWVYSDLVRIYNKMISAEKISSDDLGDSSLKVNVLYIRIMTDSFGSGLRHIKCGQEIYKKLIDLMKEKFPQEFQEAKESFCKEKEWNRRKTREGGWP